MLPAARRAVHQGGRSLLGRPAFSLSRGAFVQDEPVKPGQSSSSSASSPPESLQPPPTPSRAKAVKAPKKTRKKLRSTSTSTGDRDPPSSSTAVQGHPPSSAPFKAEAGPSSTPIVDVIGDSAPSSPGQAIEYPPASTLAVPSVSTARERIARKAVKHESHLAALREKNVVLKAEKKAKRAAELAAERAPARARREAANQAKALLKQASIISAAVALPPPLQQETELASPQTTTEDEPVGYPTPTFQPGLMSVAQQTKTPKTKARKVPGLRLKAPLFTRPLVSKKAHSLDLSSVPVVFGPGGRVLATKAKGTLGKEEAVKEEEDDDDDDATSVPSSSRNSALSLRTLRIREVISARVTGKARSLARKHGLPHMDVGRFGRTEVHGWRKMWSGRVSGEAAFRELKLVNPPTRPDVATLAHSLDRALFNPGVHLMRDPRTNVYNFDQRIRRLPHPDEIDLKRFPAYVTASKDKDLAQLASTSKSRFFGSTSTLTEALSHVWFMTSRWKQLNFDSLSMGFAGQKATYSPSSTKPVGLCLRYNEKTRTYGVDKDKTNDPPGVPRILSELGHVMESLVTRTPEDFDRFRKSSPPEAVPEEERSERQAYHYTKGRSMIMRSQLDGIDSRLPGTGVFDIKTRATASIRFDIENVEEGQHYMMDALCGVGATFERERYDMMRSAWLKYGLQARIGGMDGIFCAYHSTRYLQGFEYFPLETMDQVVYGSKEAGDHSFGISVAILERVFEAATEIFPKQSLNLLLQTPELPLGQMAVIIQPVQDDLPESERPIAELRIVAKSALGGKEVEGPLCADGKAIHNWTVDVSISACPQDDAGALAIVRSNFAHLRRANMSFLEQGYWLPDGKTEEEMQARYRERWHKEVNDPTSEYHHFAFRRATVEEAKALSDDGKVTYPLPLVKSAPPDMPYRPTTTKNIQYSLRILSREGRAKEAKRAALHAGKPVQYWRQGPLAGSDSVSPPTEDPLLALTPDAPSLPSAALAPSQ